MLLYKQIHRAAFVAALAVAGAVAGAFLAVWMQQILVTERNTRQLAELGASLLHRAELAIDYAVIAVGDLAAAGTDFCSATGQARLEALVFERGALKEIAVLDAAGRPICSTTPAGAGAAASRLDMAPLYPSRNTSIMVQPAFDERSGMFNVLWRIDGARTVVVLINVDLLMFDVFPPALRENAFAQLVAGGQDGIAAFGRRIELQQAAPMVDFIANSSRYPIEARLGVQSAALNAWNKEGEAVLIAIGSILGLALAGLASRLAIRAPHPADLLRLAIRRGQITPYYQPIFSLASGAIVGCEVLARWIRPGGSVVFPDQFIPLAESSGLVAAMTESLLAKALGELRLVLQANPAFKVAFNIAPVHFVTPGFLDSLDLVVLRAAIAPAQVVLELTERTAFPDIAIAAQVASDARRRGYRVSLDDTGTGHNGLTHIQDLSPDVIKVDKRFVDAIGMDDGAFAIIEMLVSLAGKLGATLVAEGIETEAQRDRLRQAGVDEGQGYLVARPVPLAAFNALLAEALATAGAAEQRNVRSVISPSAARV